MRNFASANVQTGEPISGDVLYIPGDLSVSATSSISPGIKWAYEFESKIPNTKPVSFNELCGEYNTREHPFDQNDTGTVSSNKYGGIKCGCKNEAYFEKAEVLSDFVSKDDLKVEGKACDHQNMVMDAGLIEFILKSAQDHQQYINYTLPDDASLELIKYGCQIFSQEFNYTKYLN